MSLWRRDGLRAWIAPTRVVVAGHARRSTADDAFEVEFDPPDPHGAVAALGTALAGRPASASARRGPIDIVLSDHYVRYVALPWRAGLADADWQAYARHELDRIFGKCATQRLVRIAAGRRGLARIASGIDAALVDALREVIAGKGLRLRSLQPNLSRVVECCERRMQGDGHLFVAEGDRLTRLAARGGVWCEVQSARCRPDLAAALARMLVESSSTPQSDAGAAKLWYWGRLDEIDRATARMGVVLQPLPRPAGVPASCAAMGFA